MNSIIHITKNLLILTTLFTLTACGFNNESSENEEQEEATSELNENKKEDSIEEEGEKTEQSSEKSAKEEAISAAENSDFQWLFDELMDKSFVFSSGVGAWGTIFTFTNNGQFSGKFSDANGPEVIVSEFTGQFNISEEMDEFTYLLELDEFQITSDTGKEEKDGDMTITYVDEPHGFQSGSSMFELYLPYKPKSEVSEEYLSWVYGQANNEYDFLNSFGLYNKTHQFGMEELVN